MVIERKESIEPDWVRLESGGKFGGLAEWRLRHAAEAFLCLLGKAGQDHGNVITSVLVSRA